MLEIGPHEEIKKLRRSPANRRLEYWAIGVLCFTILLLLPLIFLLDHLSYEWVLIIRGCAGIGVCVAVILAAIVNYRVYKSYIKQKYRRNRE